jgi:hypothetical protein
LLTDPPDPSVPDYHLMMQSEQHASLEELPPVEHWSAQSKQIPISDVIGLTTELGVRGTMLNDVDARLDFLERRVRWLMVIVAVVPWLWFVGYYLAGLWAWL